MLISNKKGEEFVYRFSDLIMIATRKLEGYSTVWWVECDRCKGRHMVKRYGGSYWAAQCELYGVQWVITPREYHISKEVDLTNIMGGE